MEQSRETLQDRIKRIQDRPLQELLRDITDSAMARQSATTATKQDRWLIVGGQTARGTTEQEKAPPTTGGQTDAQGQATTPVTDSMPAHLASPNPHPQYLLQKDYTRANGVADVVGTGTFLREKGQWVAYSPFDPSGLQADIDALEADVAALDLELDGKAPLVHAHDQYAMQMPINDGKLLSGFADNANITVSYDSAQRRITLTHPSGSIRYHYRGKEKTLASPWTSSAHSNTSGNWFLYSEDGDTFFWSNVAWKFEDVMVSYARKGLHLIFALRETHGLMDPNAHRIAHANIGTYVVSGGTLTAGTYAIGGTASDANNTPGLDATVISDEDILTSIAALPEGSYRAVYPVTATDFGFSDLARPFSVGASYIQWYNGTVATEGATGKYYVVYAIGLPTTADTASQLNRWLWTVPQKQYDTLAQAQASTLADVNLCDLTLGITEYIPRVKLIYGASASYATTGKVRLEDATYLVKGTSATAVASGTTTSWNNLADIPEAIAAIDNLPPAADKLAYYTGANTAALTTFTAFMRTLLDDADAATARATLGAQVAGSYESSIAAGTTAQYWRGDKTWQALNASSVGLGNVLNVAQEPALGNPGTSGWVLSSTTAGVRSWVALPSVPAASSTAPLMNGTAAVGTGTTWARADHVHPSDTSKLGVSAQAYDSARLGGVVAASYALASSVPLASSTTPAALGTAAVGTGTTWARADHVHTMPTAAQVGAEPSLGSGTASYLLSTNGTTRSWVAPYSHPATHPQSVVDSASGWITTALAGKQASGDYALSSSLGVWSTTNTRLTGVVDYNNISSGAEFLGSIFAGTVSNTPPGTSQGGGQGALWQCYGANPPDWSTQLFVNAQANTMNFRVKQPSNAWQAWRTVWHDGNLIGTRNEHDHSGVYQPLDSDLTAIAALATTGFVRRTAADTWSASTLVWSDISSGHPSVVAGTGLSGTGSIASNVTLSVAYGTAAGTACVGNDSRLSNARTPTAHVLDSATHTISGKAAGQVLLATGATTYAFTAISGDATLSGAGALTLATSGVTAGAYGSSSVVPVPTVDAKGRITGMATATITPSSIGAQVAGSYAESVHNHDGRYLYSEVNSSGSGSFDFDTWRASEYGISSIFYGSYTHAPPAWWHGSLIQSFGANGNWATQIAVGSGTDGLYFRRSVDPGKLWQGWRTVWHDGNLQASSSNPFALGTAAPGSSVNYSRADHVHAMPTAAQVGAAASSDLANYLPLAGGTMADAGQIQYADTADAFDAGMYWGGSEWARISRWGLYWEDTANRSGFQLYPTEGAGTFFSLERKGGGGQDVAIYGHGDGGYAYFRGATGQQAVSLGAEPTTGNGSLNIKNGAGEWTLSHSSSSYGVEFSTTNVRTLMVHTEAHVSGGIGAFGVTPPATRPTVNAASTDLATVIALTNQIRAHLIACGLVQ